MGEALIEGKSRQTATLPYLGSKKALGPRVARFERGKNAADQIVQFRAIGADTAKRTNKARHNSSF
jgi:hypothetical protein